MLKGADEHLKFVFLTGVSKFSLFSGLNNLKDITLDARYSALSGYADVDTLFAAELPSLDREHVRQWYNGDNLLGTAVHNPFDLLLRFDRRDFKPAYESGRQKDFHKPEFRHKCHKVGSAMVNACVNANACDGTLGREHRQKAPKAPFDGPLCLNSPAWSPFGAD